MKTIGLIAGMSWESSVIYYRLINELVNERLGGLHSAKIIMESVDFDEIETLQRQGNWKELRKRMENIAYNLQEAGADCIVMCTNTMHKAADSVQDLTDIPLIHIADATAEKIKESGLKKVALLGTKITMEEEFYKKRIADKYDIAVITPTEEEMRLIDRIIFDELCLGKLNWHSRVDINRIIGWLADKGAEGVILGCTELPLLISQRKLNEQLGYRRIIPLFNTLEIHVEAAVNFALQN